ncbi:2-succinyl-5-enolpyruvyl-6-hydroxy-3-cyclohexene-1-carboxylic-acid synthase [Ferrimonas sediminicola]|uniref:2-succinyl-5-enolpyruvyl-6-hydroxy-3-cyclohexene-1-carboxylate synthase n=1 Tax=Ferrimonas sediminicola TaxID=2569538 RepID=A0A4V5NUV7_9GAMM|nr:2-succinyl-5-enolpyruvyl-6-hydroxy-3-cyclohexene-1-carboxylic-acid synthase [Ferrimonas sediminicola]TKB47930.1 2-succinyl-5-enolpyruvyl-6-hydroxy-3-cyclohexene-1-carboxylic-acid synthase [Ferrimonas sediminicola]
MNTTPIADLNLLWSKLMLEELWRLGVKHICLAPGSRSTPLTLAAAEHPGLTRHTHFDERGLAFLAMGLAKSSRSPVALVTTSGTALANLYPAIVEAFLTRVPLILLTGDRPPELIDCGANQAIIQPGIFAGYCTRVDLPTPDLGIAPQALLTQLDHALGSSSGPVHVNCMFREPLYPKADRTDFSDYLAPIGHWLRGDQPWSPLANLSSKALPTEAQCHAFANGKGVIVAGTLAPEQDPQQLVDLAKRLGWPLLADCQSQLRQADGVVHHIDQLLQREDCQSLLAQAEHLLLVGARTLSKRMLGFIEAHHWAAQWQWLQYPQRLDPNHKPKQVCVGDLEDLMALPWPTKRRETWAPQLIQASDALDRMMERLHGHGELTELSAIRHLSQALPDGAQLFIGNSLPVRLFDTLAAPVSNPPPVYTNRGASGIDGLLATATGVGRGSRRPTLLAIGDLSLLHDLNSLALVRDCDFPMVVLAINNDGGSIFNLLPVPNEPLRQEYYRLGHGLRFQGAAQQFGLPYLNPVSLDQFKETLAGALASNGPTLVELSLPPKQSAELLVALAKAVKDVPLG